MPIVKVTDEGLPGLVHDFSAPQNKINLGIVRMRSIELEMQIELCKNLNTKYVRHNVLNTNVSTATTERVTVYFYHDNTEYQHMNSKPIYVYPIDKLSIFSERLTLLTKK